MKEDQMLRSLGRRFLNNAIIDTLIHLKGNERACLWTEPLWGIPYNLYIPYASQYMALLGLSGVEIGVVSTVFLISQMFWAMLSGVLTDKLGRRKCTLIFDCLSWSVPAFLWMCAQNIYWFLVAALFNGMWRITENSWDLLMAEEAPPEKLVHMYSISHIAGLLAGFIAPIPYFFVQRYDVVPTMRVLYGITFVMMTSKFIILYFLCRETATGKRRMAECKNISLWAYLLDSRHVLKGIVTNKRVMMTVGLVACFASMKNINNDFWSLLVTQRLGIAEENLSIFATLRAVLMLVMFFTVVPRISLERFKHPLLGSLACYLGVLVLMLLLPAGMPVLVFVGVFFEAVSLAMLNPLVSSLQMSNAEKEQRARIIGLFYAICLAVTAPFGLIAGQLSDINRSYPFWLTTGLAVIAMAFAWNLAKESSKGAKIE